MVTDYTVKFQIIAAWSRGEVELTDSGVVQGCLKPTQKHPYLRKKTKLLLTAIPWDAENPILILCLWRNTLF